MRSVGDGDDEVDGRFVYSVSYASFGLPAWEKGKWVATCVRKIKRDKSRGGGERIVTMTSYPQ